MKKSFFGHERPLITALLQENSVEGLLREIALTKKQGADAFGVQLEALPAEMRTEDALRTVFAATEDKPVYVTCYERYDAVEEDDDVRAETLLRALSAGAVMADLRCDLFCTTPYEMTYDEIAVGKQKALADTIHAMGKEVLFSRHVWDGKTFRFLKTDEVIAVAREQAARGADMAKIVTGADTEEELAENFATLIALKKQVPIPTLFLCNGAFAMRHRLACGLVSEPLVFVREDSVTDANNIQGPVSTYAALFRAAGIPEENR